MYSQLGVGPLPHLFCSSHVRLLYIISPCHSSYDHGVNQLGKLCFVTKCEERDYS